MDKSKMEKKCDIFGSCVTRDIWEFQKEEKLICNKYFARESIISAVSKPVPLNTHDLQAGTDYRKSLIIHDFNKDVFDILAKEGGDYIIIDLIDERFKLIKINGSVVTYSSELAESNFPKAKKDSVKKVNDSKYEFDGKNIKRYMKKFCKRIKKIYPTNHIFIHKAYGCMQYRNMDNEICEFDDKRKAVWASLNKRLKYMYNYMEINLKGCKTIDICNRYVADAKHKWGLAPMHYEKEYYENVLEIIYNKMDL